MKRFVIEYWVPLVLWLLLIFFFSSDAFSSGETSHIIIPLLKFLAGSLSSESLDFFHAVIRKLGHITEYFVLALLTYRSVKHENVDLMNASVRTFGCVLFAAAFDEVHQHFTVFRTASPFDVGYDCLGAVWALWLIITYEIRRLRTHPVL